MTIPAATPAAPAAAPAASQEAPAAPAGTTPAAPAPGAAPAAPAAAAEAFSYEPTGNPALDLALGIVATAGIDPEHPALVAAQGGDFDLLAAELAIRDPKGADQAVALLKREYEAELKRAEEREVAVGETILAQAGTAEAWTQAVEWVRGEASEEEKSALNEMLADPIKAKIAAAYVVNTYRLATNADAAPTTSAVAPTAAARPSQQSSGPITRRELAEEGQKLYAKYGDRYRESSEFKALAARLR